MFFLVLLMDLVESLGVLVEMKAVVRVGHLEQCPPRRKQLNVANSTKILMLYLNKEMDLGSWRVVEKGGKRVWI